MHLCIRSALNESQNVSSAKYYALINIAPEHEFFYFVSFMPVFKRINVRSFYEAEVLALPTSDFRVTGSNLCCRLPS